MLNLEYQPRNRRDYGADTMLPAMCQGTPTPPASPVLLLASRSPRRAQLLTDAGIAFLPCDSSFVDPAQPVDPRQAGACVVASELSLLKAQGALGRTPVTGPAVILAADTICVLEGRLIGTPSTPAEARSILEAFVSKPHEVVTGVTLLPVQGATGQVVNFAEVARVHFGDIPAAEIESYLATDLWKGKAGAYNYDDRLAAGWDIRCEAGADPTCIVGLPMRRLVAELERFGIRSGPASKPSTRQHQSPGHPCGASA